MYSLTDVGTWTTSSSARYTSESHISPTTSRKAHEQLLDLVEQYFISSSTSSQSKQELHNSASGTSNSKVTCTPHAPLYLQQPGHSLTVVGLEILDTGARNLLVLDPAYKPSPGVTKLLDAYHAGSSPLSAMLKPAGSGSAKDSPAGSSSAKKLQKPSDKAKATKEVTITLKPGGGGLVRRKRTVSEISTSMATSASSRSWRGSGSGSGHEHRGGDMGAASYGTLADGAGVERTTMTNDKAKSKVESKSRSGLGSGGGRSTGIGDVQASRLLDAYRRGKGRLARFREFEVLELLPGAFAG